VIGPLADLARAALFRLDPETAHRLAIRGLSTGLAASCGARAAARPRLAVEAFGLAFPNPVGMAAGFDKNAEAADGLIGLGFGFVEVGTVTPRPQAGNPRPRMFRLPDDRALINRLGFNNDGHGRVLERLQARRRAGGATSGIVGVNVGANRDAADRIADYVAGIEAFAPEAAYLTINVSSPNTPGLRALQEGDALADLLGRAVAARDARTAAIGRRVPLLLKVAPDLDDAQIAAIAGTAVAAAVDGLIVGNTTVARPALAGPHAAETGGLSGRPLFHRSTVVLARFHRALAGRLPLVGVGGVENAETAFAKILAGASLVQVYTGFIYEGPAIVGRLLDGLEAALDRRRLGSLADAVGLEAEAWAARDPDG